MPTEDLVKLGSLANFLGSGLILSYAERGSRLQVTNIDQVGAALTFLYESGSPILDDAWPKVCLHFAGIIEDWFRCFKEDFSAVWMGTSWVTTGGPHRMLQTLYQVCPSCVVKRLYLHPGFKKEASNVKRVCTFVHSWIAQNAEGLQRKNDLKAIVAWLAAVGAGK